MDQNATKAISLIVSAIQDLNDTAVGNTQAGRAVVRKLIPALGHIVLLPDAATDEEYHASLVETANKATEETKEAAVAFLGRQAGIHVSQAGMQSPGDGFQKAIHFMLQEGLRLSGYAPTPAMAEAAYSSLPQEGRDFYRRFSRSIVEYLQDGLREEV